MNVSDARKAHKILDDLLKGNRVLDGEREFLRSALPELPKQKTLEEICVMVEGLCGLASSPEGFLPIGGMGVRPHLEELHAQLQGLEDAPANTPALPDGMRLADHQEYGRCVVSQKADADGDHLAFVTSSQAGTGCALKWVDRYLFTFVDAEPAHPEFLETEEDYENAPEGTVVARDNGLPWVKEKSNYWTRPDAAKSDYGMSLGSRRILRWGWGE